MRKMNTSDFIKKAKYSDLNDIYDLTLIDYETSKINIKIICHKHGIFNIMPSNFLNGQGWP